MFQDGKWQVYGIPFAYEVGWDVIDGRSYEEVVSTACVLAVTGPGTAFGERDSPRLSILDLAPDTILLIESKNSGIKWPQPGDVDIRWLRKNYRVDAERTPASIHEGGFHVAFADGSAWFLRSDTPFRKLEPFLTVEGARNADREKLLAEFRIAP